MANILRCQLCPGHRLDDWHWLVCGQSFGRVGGPWVWKYLMFPVVNAFGGVDTTQEQRQKECSGTGNCAILHTFHAFFLLPEWDYCRLNLVSPAAHIKHFLKVNVAPHRFLYQSRLWKPLAF